MVSAPAGMRCRECATHHFLKSTQAADPERIAWAVSASFAVAFAGVVLLRGLGIFAMALGPVYGYLVAETIRAIAGKSARFSGYEYAGPLVILAAVIIACIPPFSGLAVQLTPLPAQFAQFTAPIVGLGIGLAVSACYKRLRSAAS
jgi:hypothetical protein